MKSWQTTLFGAVTAAGLGLAQSDDPLLKTIGQIMAVIGPVLLGFFAKGKDVTGGTIVQPSSAEAKSAITEMPTSTPPKL